MSVSTRIRPTSLDDASQLLAEHAELRRRQSNRVQALPSRGTGETSPRLHDARCLLVMPNVISPQVVTDEVSPAGQPERWPVTPVDLLRAEDVARRLQISRTKVYDLLRSGKLRSVKLGGCRRVTVAALAEFIAKLDGGPAA